MTTLLNLAAKAETPTYEKEGSSRHEPFDEEERLLCRDREKREGDGKMVKLLLEWKADVKLANSNGVTALHTAAINGEIASFDLLREKGAEVNAQCHFGRTPLMMCLSVFIASPEDAYERVKKIYRTLIEIPEININAVDATGKSALHLAVINCQAGTTKYEQKPDITMVQLLLNKNANVDAVDNDGKTAIHYAAIQSRRHIAQLLIDKNVNVDAVDKVGKTAFHYAAIQSERYVDNIVQLLIDNDANIHAADKKGKTALHYFTIQSAYDNVKLLIKKNANINAVDNDGQTALHHAARQSHDVAQLLLENKADISVADGLGKTALHYSAMSHHPDIVELLLNYKSLGENGQQQKLDMEKKDFAGFTALHIATNFACYDAFKALYHAKANVNTESTPGVTPLWTCMTSLKKGWVFTLCDGKSDDRVKKQIIAGREKIFFSLIHNPDTNIHVVDAQKRTLLHHAAFGSSAFMVRHVLTRDKSSEAPRKIIEKKDSDGCTALHIATRRACVDAFRELYKWGADINAQCKLGRTPLMICIIEGTVKNRPPPTDCEIANHWTPKLGPFLRPLKKIYDLLVPFREHCARHDFNCFHHPWLACIEQSFEPRSEDLHVVWGQRLDLNLVDEAGRSALYYAVFLDQWPCWFHSFDDLIELGANTVIGWKDDGSLLTDTRWFQHDRYMMNRWDHAVIIRSRMNPDEPLKERRPIKHHGLDC
jgi:ankyrin repeat protein